MIPRSARLLCLFSLVVPSLAPGCAELPGREQAAASDRRLDWWREARFGLFIHWGLYAVPAGEWRGDTGHGEWIRETARIPLEEYERFQGRFDPVRFDPDQWVALAREAGMRYLVITSKHHDGFCLFDSAETGWDVMETPYGRDILAELSAACARGGVRFCTYHSIMDWHHPDYLPRRSWETRSAQGADYERFEDYLHAQVTEVITRYRPGVMWFDGEWESTWTHERGVELYELCRGLDPELIVNNRVDVHRGGMAGFSASSEAVGDFGTPEQEIPATGLPGVDWETCMTMNDHWGWNRNDRNWKSVETLVRNLIDVASKGGNYLLNVGPKADGTFPEEAVERLKGIGTWMKKHGEAIHGTSASPFDALPWGRCTAKTNDELTHLFLHVFERPPDGRLVVPGLGNEVNQAGWVYPANSRLPVHREGTDVVVELPAGLPDPIAAVVQLCVRGEPIVYRPPEIVAESDIFVRPLRVDLDARNSQLVVHYTLDGSEPTVDSPRFTRSIELSGTTQLLARCFHRGKPVSGVARASFERVLPRPARTGLKSAGRGVAVSIYKGDWNVLPDLDHLPATGAAVISAIGMPGMERAEYEARRFHGLLEVPRDDVYSFALASDDGSDLWIDGVQVIDNDGLHGTLKKTGRTALAAGLHEIEVRWFNKTGGAELALRWAPLGGELEPVPVLLQQK